MNDTFNLRDHRYGSEGKENAEKDHDILKTVFLSGHILSKLKLILMGLLAHNIIINTKINDIFCVVAINEQ